MTISIRFKRLVPEARLPTQGKPGDAAYDLYCVKDFSIYPGYQEIVSTGLQLADMPTEQGDSLLHLEIKGRSGMASKGLYPIGGVIDATYRGEIKVILRDGNVADSKDPNGSRKHFRAGDRIAQIEVVKTAKGVEMKETQEVSETSRGLSGFGSTGT